MNISQPVASNVKSVDFGFLSSEEIKALSVKRIQNPITFDSLQHPVPGGLYDNALGPWQDNPCTTCRLNTHNCPGHVGHIDLPVPLYHPTFLLQLLNLLKARCAYCSHFRMAPLEINHYICRLRLIEYGLIEALVELDNLEEGEQLPDSGLDVEGINEKKSHASDEVEQEGLSDDILQKREDFVQKAIRGARRLHQEDFVHDQSKIEAVAEQRRVIIKEFMSTSTKKKKCARCQGISPELRHNRFNKIFQRPLNKKAKAKMTQLGLRVGNSLLQASKMKSAHQKRKEQDIDEGIDVGSEEASPSEEEGEDIRFSDAMSDENTDGEGSDTAPPDVQPDQYISPQRVYHDTVNLFQEEKLLLELIYNHRRKPTARPISADMFFIQTIVVPPNKFRPETRTGNGEIAEASEHEYYKNILKCCQRISECQMQCQDESISIELRRRSFDVLQATVINLQDAVNTLLDTSRGATASIRQNMDGIKQKLEKKDGLFRKHMMGKRVNFAARSVISPDPNIDTNEIGVPPVFARKLTYPEPVTNHNFYELKEAVLNGPDKWPGASAVENETGQVINLRTKNFEERQALANQLLAPSSTSVNGSCNKKVHRHLTNGDIVLMNRQPTLHKPSIMAHRTRVLPGEKTIRMHYANCNTYNADFDGDEMNMHFPQNEIARAEAFDIADTDHQYLVATSGKPLRGLIQDHLSMGVWLTNKDSFFDREDYYQLLCSCLRPERGQTNAERITTITPAIVKPRQLWTGKQVVTTVLRNLQPLSHPGLTMQGKSQTPGDRWGANVEENVVLVQDGELVCGILDKASLGPTNGGFVHAVYEAYGHTIAGRLLSVLGCLLTKFLNMRAWTCGMDDLQLTPSGDAARQDVLKQTERMGLEVAAKYVTLEEKSKGMEKELEARLHEVLRDNSKQAGLDGVYTARVAKLSSEITAVCLPNGLEKPFPRNQMQTMTISGAKGSQVNANQISCNLGQQILEGRRVPIMVSGKTLPSFEPLETHVRAGGYITDRFLTGVKPQEYYFHAMAGREGLIDTAVKTSRSGYLQRCLIKGMEGLKTEYDRSVRDSDGSLVQFLYGEDGLDVTKQKHLTDFRFIASNYLSFAQELNIREEYSKLLRNTQVEDVQKRTMKKFKKSGRIDCVDPVLALYNPGLHLGSTSEKFAAAVKTYADENPDGLLKKNKHGGKENDDGMSNGKSNGKSKGIDNAKGNGSVTLAKRSFQALLDVKYLKSLIEPGEAVGLVVGQSIGEPSTQMTLNTFHLAGHAAKNVTLGIPRLREIVMTASKHIPTPNMTLFPIRELSEDAMSRFAKGITKLTLAEVIDKVHVQESIGGGTDSQAAKIYQIRFEFFKGDDYCEQYAIQKADVLQTLELKFVPILCKAIKKDLSKKGAARSLKDSEAQPEIGKSAGKSREYGTTAGADQEGGKDDADEDDDDDDRDGDASNDKQKKNRDGAATYDAPDDEEKLIAKRAQKEMTPERGGDEDVDDDNGIDDIDSGLGGSPRPGKRKPMRKDEIDEEDDEKTDEMDARGDRPDGMAGKAGVAAVANRLRKADAQSCEERLKARFSSVAKFRFDTSSKAQWCELRLEYPTNTAKLLLLPLIEAACHAAVIQSIPNLGVCSFSHEDLPNKETGHLESVPVVNTQGVNLQAMHHYQDVIDPHRILTNDIWAMMCTYGVEAGRNTIIREMDAVFAGHGITVDQRHLNLIADFMTRDGGFRPFSRLGLASSVSPFQKASFESTLAYLRDAVLDGDWDELRNPSARIVMGKLSRVGTGAFDVLMPLNDG